MEAPWYASVPRQSSSWSLPIKINTINNTRVFAEKVGWVGVIVVCFLYKVNPNPRKTILLWEKVAQTSLFNLIFLGLGWPWVGEFVGFIIIFTSKYIFQPQQN